MSERPLCPRCGFELFNRVFHIEDVDSFVGHLTESEQGPKEDRKFQCAKCRAIISAEWGGGYTIDQRAMP